VNDVQADYFVDKLQIKRSRKAWNLVTRVRGSKKSKEKRWSDVRVIRPYMKIVPKRPLRPYGTMTTRVSNIQTKTVILSILQDPDRATRV
jgi:hypothetical protein